MSYGRIDIWNDHRHWLYLKMRASY